jgi:D-glycero-alpha-D-manno-heptose-7-phosphate kinase
MREALLAGDWQRVSRIMLDAHPTRKRLAPNVTTPQMDRLVEKAMQNGAEAAKVCGAGGGGCIAFFCEEGRREEVERALKEEAGVEIIDWKIDREGLIVRES